MKCKNNNIHVFVNLSHTQFMFHCYFKKYVFSILNDQNFVFFYINEQIFK